MSVFWTLSTVILWAVVLFLGFLLLGALRALGILKWQLEQLQATTPSRLGRDGLRLGKEAPAFSLPSTEGKDIALADFAGHKVLLVFVQGGCSPCHQVVPELSKLHRKGEPTVLAVFNGDPEASRKWAGEVNAEFSVLSQDKLAVSKRYQVFTTPFAFLIDEKGIIASKGIVNNAQHVGYVLAGRGAGAKDEHAEPEAAEGTRADESHSFHSVKKVSHV